MFSLQPATDEKPCGCCGVNTFWVLRILRPTPGRPTEMAGVEVRFCVPCQDAGSRIMTHGGGDYTPPDKPLKFGSDEKIDLTFAELDRGLTGP